eukprot:CAMPEP_0185029750 /NCGR_PEP_ID=MMETSP1103-20130426/16246_1 /TAXON_ID=36769 /ORGANISM="Paraphysomonas bandaiensis, Strain Caron Lab Isolate" /LENGTH=320 /DNA_ID=CAMNT_0027564605 /DNA_START=56 /DNA_END=1014 /DNA_ORIENTATION=-
MVEVLRCLVQTMDSKSTHTRTRGAKWRNDSELDNAIRVFKNESDVLSNSCTKLALINPADMPADGLKSLFDEIFNGAQRVYNCYRLLSELPLSSPFAESLHKSVRNELTEVQGLIHSVGTGQFEACKSAVGLVWDANKAIQKLPNTNKAAYKRSIMEAMMVVQDTNREFRQALSAMPTDGKPAATDDFVDDEFSDMEDEDYTPEDVPYVEACLSLMVCCFNIMRQIIEIATVVSEKIESANLETKNESVASSHLADGVIEQWVADLHILCHELKKSVVDLGVEMYAPLELEGLASQFNAVNAIIQQIISKIDTDFAMEHA